MNKINKKYFFSLIELLCVMVISILLIGIAIPTFNAITQGQKVETAARTIGSQLKSVRSSAITRREYIALIIPTTEDLSSDYLYRSYRPCIVNSSSVFQAWISGEKWEFLPPGTAIIDIDNTIGHSGTSAGTFTSAGTITSVDFSSIGIEARTNAQGITFSPTGKSFNPATRKYVTIGEATLLEDSVTSTSDLIEITIDLYSGRISYGSK